MTSTSSLWGGAGAYLGSSPMVGLAAVPALESGESAQSFMWRCSEINGVTQLDAAQALGMTALRSDGRNQIDSDYFNRPPPSRPDIAALPKGAFLSDLAGKAFRADPAGGLRVLALRERIRVSNSLICPECLRERPAYWRLWWRSGLAFMCPKHRCLLSAYCPQCRSPHATGRRDKSVVPAHSFHVGSTTRCLNPAPYGTKKALEKLPCWHDLTMIATASVRHSGLMWVQKRVLAALQGQPVRAYGEAELEPLHFLDDLWLLCWMALFASPATAAGGLDERLVDAWKRHCEARDGALKARKGRKGSKDHAYTKVPEPELLAVAAANAAPVMRAETAEEARARLAVLVRFVEARNPSASQRVRKQARASTFLRTALAEVTIKESAIKPYLTNHPKRGRWLDFRHFDDQITPDWIRQEVPELVKRVKPEMFVLPLQVLTRYFISHTAQSLADVLHPSDPQTMKSKLLRLGNEASVQGVSRKVARLIVELATSHPEYEVETQALSVRGRSVTWYVRKT